MFDRPFCLWLINLILFTMFFSRNKIVLYIDQEGTSEDMT